MSDEPIAAADRAGGDPSPQAMARRRWSGRSRLGHVSTVNSSGRRRGNSGRAQHDGFRAVQVGQMVGDERSGHPRGVTRHVHSSLIQPACWGRAVCREGVQGTDAPFTMN